VIVKITANLSGDGESWWHRQTNARHFVEICAFATQQRFLRALSISVAIPEIVNVTRRARYLGCSGFARSGADRFPRALKSFFKISFPFCGHKLAAAATAEMTKRQTKFGRHDVNGQAPRATLTSALRGSAAALLISLGGSVVKLALFRRS
jgi:hypothetical protein